MKSDPAIRSAAEEVSGKYFVFAVLLYSIHPYFPGQTFANSSAGVQYPKENEI